MKKMEENKLIIKILVYSAIKIIAKVPLLYSVLKPETSSDSPSAKSKGVRFVSARVVVNHTRNKGKLTKIVGTIVLIYIIVMLKVLRITRTLRRVKDILTS